MVLRFVRHIDLRSLPGNAVVLRYKSLDEFLDPVTHGRLYFTNPPHRLCDSYAKMRRVGDEWQIAAREKSLYVFERLDQPVALKEWATEEGKVAPSS